MDGNITGTPTSVGSYTFAIGVTDRNGAIAEKEFTIEVTNPLSIVTDNLPRATKGSPYQQSIAADGGTQPYSVIPIAPHFYHRWDTSSVGGWTCNQSRDYCISDGGYLITISSSDENSKATFSSGYAWIGLSDASSEGIWVWEQASHFLLLIGLVVNQTVVRLKIVLRFHLRGSGMIIAVHQEEITILRVNVSFRQACVA